MPCFCQKTSYIRPPRWTFWALSLWWCAAPLSLYAQSSKRLGWTVGCDHTGCFVKVFAILSCMLYDLIFSPLARAHICCYDADAGEWEKFRGGRWQGLLVFQWDGCGVRLLQQTYSLQSCPCLQGNRVYCLYCLFLSSSNSLLRNNVKLAFPLAVTPFFPLVDCPSCLCTEAFCLCVHRAMLEVSGLYKRSGHPSWRPDWTVRFWSLSCLTSFRTLTAGVTPAAAGITVCSTVCSRHSRKSEYKS